MLKIVELCNKRIFLVDKFIGIDIPELYINLSTYSLSFEFESGLTDTFDILSDTTYTITPSDSWIGVNYISGSGNLTVTVGMVSENSGLTSRTGTITVYNAVSGITRVLNVTQNYDVLPLLYIMTEGGEFSGEIV